MQPFPYLCVCEREIERRGGGERERDTAKEYNNLYSLCVWKEREKGGERDL